VKLGCPACLLEHSPASRGNSLACFVLANMSWFILLILLKLVCACGTGLAGSCSGLHGGGSPGSTATIGIFGIGVLGFVLE